MADRSAAGKSLWSDAWQKLLRSRMAIASMIVLALVALTAFLTPLLPLQPSDRYYTDLQFAEPTTGPPPQGLGLSLDTIASARTDATQLRDSLDDQRTSMQAEMRAELAAAKPDAIQAVRDTWRDKLREQRKAASNQVEDTYMRPYRDAGFPPDLGPLARWMIRSRIALFGDYQIPSLFGRDKMGRDLLAQICWGARVSLIVGIVATLVSLVIGVTYGAVSGYAGGWIDALMMRFVDVLYSVPFIFVVIFLLTILGQEDIKKQLSEYGISRITIFYVVVGAIYWLTMARVVRGQVLSLKHELFVEAARAQGAGWGRIVALHLVPNVASVVIVYLTLTIPRVMLFEAFLSFLGLGVQSPDVSWGLLAKEGMSVITPLRTYWWLVVYPSAAIGLTLFALNFFGDALRDALDPRLRSE
jgi:oligopeptide transport system permease protein